MNDTDIIKIVYDDRDNVARSMTLKGRKLSPEHIRKSVEGNKGKIISSDTRHKLSIANRCKKHLPEHRKKISRALVHPNKSNAFKMLNSLPTDMPPREKRELFFNKFTEIPKGTLYRWFSEWYKFKILFEKLPNHSKSTSWDQ